ncbi:MAG: hypothetical protein RL522_764 [Pseudomonadota bacterium]|jgi:putative peptide zinc metalloprotease protein
MSLPPLREELALLPGPHLADGQPSWTLHDPVRHQFFRIDWLTFEILARWSLGDAQTIAHSITTRTTLHPQADDVQQVLEFLTHNQLLLQRGPGAAERLGRHLHAVQGTPLKQLMHHYLFFRVPLVRPDAWLQRWVGPVTAFFTSRGFLVATVLALTFGLLLVARSWDSFLHTLVDTFNLPGLAAYGAALTCVKLLHELGHAFTARRHGCRVPAMGVAFLVMWPMAYTDTTETWRLTDRWKRLQVASAGIATEWVVAIWATLAWALLPDGTLRGAMFALATTSWVATLAVNASPFMRFDGYFILCDALDMPNLHERSFALARWKLREWLFALNASPPEHFTPRKQAALIAFAWAVWLYRLVVFIGIAVLVYHFFIKLVGIVLFIVEIGWFIVLPVWRELTAWQALRAQVAARPASRRHVRRVASCAVLVAAVALVPWPGRVAASGWLRPAQAWPVYAPAASQLENLHHAEGTHLPQGVQLLRLTSPQLESRLQVAAARTELLGWQVNTAALLADTRARWQVTQEELATSQVEQVGLQAQREQLTPAAPFDATLRDLDPDLRPGQWLAARERIATLVGDGPMVVEAYLDENAVKRVRPGDPALFITDGLEGPALRLTVQQVDADASRQLAHGMLAAPAGGDVLTRERQGQRVPEHAVYRVVLRVDSAPEDLSGRAWRGRVVIRAAGEPLAGRYLRQALTVLVREAGM